MILPLLGSKINVWMQVDVGQPAGAEKFNNTWILFSDIYSHNNLAASVTNRLQNKQNIKISIIFN